MDIVCLQYEQIMSKLYKTVQQKFLPFILYSVWSDFITKLLIYNDNEWQNSKIKVDSNFVTVIQKFSWPLTREEEGSQN